MADAPGRRPDTPSAWPPHLGWRRRCLRPGPERPPAIAPGRRGADRPAPPGEDWTTARAERAALGCAAATRGRSLCGPSPYRPPVVRRGSEWSLLTSGVLPQVEAARQVVGWPAEESNCLRARKAVGHAVDISDRVEPEVSAPG